jgi:FlaA1/EpsC-like NDP-sugar epimerase
MFSKLYILPRWVIFTIDITLCLIALLIAKIVVYSLPAATNDHIALYKSLLAVMAVNTLVFTNFKTYAGIVRFTSAQDSFRILFSVFASALLLFIVNAFTYLMLGVPLISNIVLILYSLFSFLFLTTYRILVKYFFMYIKSSSLEQIRIIIYGAGEAGMATKAAFDQAHKVDKQIVAFADDDPRKVSKTIDGIKIIAADKLDMLIMQHDIDQVIFASYTIPPARKNQLAELCLQYQVQLLNIPPHEVWSKGNVRLSQIHHLNIEDLLNRETIEIDTVGIQEALKDKRILITGAAGSIGSEMVRQLMKFKTGLILLCDQNETALHHLSLELHEDFESTNFHSFIGDVRDVGRMEFLFRTFNPHYVYHAAAYKHVPMMEENPVEAVKTNVLGTKVIADLSVKYGVEKFVMISTDKAVNPGNVMGASKRIAEIYVQSLNKSDSCKFITTRFGNVLGSNGSVIPRFKQQIEKGGPVTVTHPEITRYFMTIPEACRLVLEAGNMGNGGEIFIFDMGKSVKIVDLAIKMIRLAGLVPHKDIKISYSGLRPGEKLYEELLSDCENSLPTHHEKIMIGKVREYVFEEVEGQIHQLLAFAGANDHYKVVWQMKMIVPEFKSKNSRFEALDQLENLY